MSQTILCKNSKRKKRRKSNPHLFPNPTNHSQSGFHLTSHTLFPIVPDLSDHFAFVKPATHSESRELVVPSWSRSKPETGVQCPQSPLKHSAFGELIRRTGHQFGEQATFSKPLDPVEPSPPYQNDFRIILIFVAPIFDSPFSYQKYFLGLIDCSSVDYDIFLIFAVEKHQSYESSYLCKSIDQRSGL